MAFGLASAGAEPTGGIAGWAVDLMDSLGEPVPRSLSG